MHEITVSKEVGTLLRDNVLKLYKKPSFHNSRVIGINKDYESWLNHLELAEALRVSENCDRVSETGESGLADTLTKKENIRNTNNKKEKESALPGDDGTEFLVHPNSGELYKVVGGVMYNKKGKRLNQAGYIDIDFGLSKGGLF